MPAYVIATGSRPTVTGIAGVEDVDVLTSTTAMELDQLPASLVVIGGGYVGMEQAQLFAHLGAKVTIIGTLAPNPEPELRLVVADVFTEDGITVVEHVLNLDAAGVETDERRFVVIDARQRTTNPRVFAGGDVAGTPQYVYVAAASGRSLPPTPSESLSPRRGRWTTWACLR